MKYFLIEFIVLLILFPIGLYIRNYYRKKRSFTKSFLQDVKDTFQKAIKGDIFSIIFILCLFILALFVIAGCLVPLVEFLEKFLPYPY